MGRYLTGQAGGIARTLLAGLAVAALLGVLATAGVYAHYRSVMEAPVLEPGDSTTLVIPKSTSWPGVVDRLVESGLVDHRWYFEFWARRRGLPRDAKAGEYELKGPLEWAELEAKLREGGKAKGVEITIPEGWTMFHVAERLARRGLVEADTFLEAARSNALLEGLGLEVSSVEGYLYPDTYRFSEEASAEDIIGRMVRRWRTAWQTVVVEHGDSLRAIKREYGFSRHDIVTLASLIQAETPVEEDRPIISRVFLNRLDRGMRLQTDPTCVYGPEIYLRQPTPDLCNDPSNEYSTYAHDGLPPGPIGNPPRASLAAAVNPSDSDEASAYLYFVAKQDGSGEHVFSKSYAQHRRAIRKYLK